MTRLWALLTVLVVLAAACSQGSTTSDRQAERDARRTAREAARCQRRGTCPSTLDTGTLPPPSPGTTAPSGPLKPVLKGLLDREGQPPAPYLGTAVRGWVVKAYWKDLQPAPGGPLAANNVIDQAVTAAQRLNAQNPSLGLGLKLRVYTGIYAPDWAKSLGGSPVSVVDPQDQEQGTVGRFWTDDFGRAYADLERKLAERYDNVAEVREVVVSRCTTFFASPSSGTRATRPRSPTFSVPASASTSTRPATASRSTPTRSGPRPTPTSTSAPTRTSSARALDQWTRDSQSR